MSKIAPPNSFTDLPNSLIQNVISLSTSGFGVVVALAWNEAIKSVIEYLFPLDQNTMAAKIIYAAVMTMILVFATAYILKEPNEEKK